MRILVIITSVLLLASCRKEAKIRYRFAGVWNITELEVSYYTNNQTDSSYKETNVGTWLMSDNISDSYNILEYHHEKEPPKSFRELAIIAGISLYEGSMGWYTDNTTDHRLTITKPLYVGAVYIVFTVVKSKKNRFVLQYIEPDAGNPEYVGYKEIWTFQRE